MSREAARKEEKQNMHKHQHDLLVLELKSTEHDGKTAEQVVASLRQEAQDWADAKTAALKTPADATVGPAMRAKLDTDPKYLPTPRRLTVYSFCSRAKYDKKHSKLRHGLIPVSDECAAQFPGGVPGMPNIIRPDEFAAAWKEARGLPQTIAEKEQRLWQS